MTESELQQFTNRTVYDATLWIAAKDSRTGAVAATGIADLDREIREGILEWIQVSPEYRGCGLGRWLVCELLRRMQGRQISPPYPAGAAIPLTRSSFTGPVVLQAVMYGTS